MAATRDHGGSRLRFSGWNLLLLIPLLMLVTPMINFDEPRLLGLPFFYWSQFGFMVVGVACVSTVYMKTRNRPERDDDGAGAAAEESR